MGRTKGLRIINRVLVGVTLLDSVKGKKKGGGGERFGTNSRRSSKCIIEARLHL
jgi:hypothetical protein